MFTETYIEALLVDEELADQVWEAWDAGELNDAAACIAWMLIIRQAGTVPNRAFKNRSRNTCICEPLYCG